MTDEDPTTKTVVLTADVRPFKRSLARVRLEMATVAAALELEPFPRHDGHVLIWEAELEVTA